MGIGWIGSFERSDTAPPCILPPLPYPICCSDSSAAVTASVTKLITTRANIQQIAVNFILFTGSPFLVNGSIKIFFGCDFLRFIIKLFYLFISQTQGASANVEKEIHQRQMRDVQTVHDRMCRETLCIKKFV